MAPFRRIRGPDQEGWGPCAARPLRTVRVRVRVRARVRVRVRVRARVHFTGRPFNI